MRNREQRGTTLRTLLRLARLQLSAGMMYRLNFWGTFLADLCFFAVQLAFFGVIGSNGGVGDWTAHHLTVFTGTFMALDGLYMSRYFFGILSIPDQVRTGKLDLALTKPVNALAYVSFGGFNAGSLLLFVIGLGVTAWGGMGLGVLDPLPVLRYLLVFLCMAVLVFALMLLLRCSAFWLVEAGAIYQMEDTLLEFAFRLPKPAIQGIWRAVLFLLLPYGLMANLPAEALFGGLSVAGWLVCFLVPAAFLALALLLWRCGLRRYDSASS